MKNNIYRVNIKSDNEKLLNLYQNKEKLLDEKRNELAEANANYAELKEEKNYIEKYLYNQGIIFLHNILRKWTCRNTKWINALWFIKNQSRRAKIL